MFVWILDAQTADLILIAKKIVNAGIPFNSWNWPNLVSSNFFPRFNYGAKIISNKRDDIKSFIWLY
jgi:hypothetical protein